MRISDWSSDACSSDLLDVAFALRNDIERARAHTLCQRDASDVAQSLAQDLFDISWQADDRVEDVPEIGVGGIGLSGVGVDRRRQDQLVAEAEELDDRLVVLVAKLEILLPAPSVDEPHALRSEEHTSELQSLMRISYAVFCLKKKTL